MRERRSRRGIVSVVALGLALVGVQGCGEVGNTDSPIVGPSADGSATSAVDHRSGDRNVSGVTKARTVLILVDGKRVRDGKFPAEYEVERVRVLVGERAAQVSGVEGARVILLETKRGGRR